MTGVQTCALPISDRRIDLCEQGGWNLRDGDAPVPGRRGEARQITDHATAKGNNGAVSRQSGAGECVVNPREGLLGFVHLSVGKDAFMDWAVAQKSPHSPQI
mgnify:CR=1 FL=1